MQFIGWLFGRAAAGLAATAAMTYTNADTTGGGYPPETIVFAGLSIFVGLIAKYLADAGKEEAQAHRDSEAQAVLDEIDQNEAGIDHKDTT